jgi:putative flippase GtrA
VTSAARYLLVGVANTAVTLIAIVLIMRLGAEVLTANLIGYVLGVGLSYTLNKMWTFRSARPVAESLPRFLLVVAVAYFANLMVVWISHYLLSIDGYAAQLLGMPIYIAVGYIGSRMFAFKSAQPI